MDFGLGPEPEWLKCSCGEITNRVPCWTCLHRQARQAEDAEADEVAAKALPRRFAWARVDAPELRARVRCQGNLETLTRRILGAGNVVFTGPSGSGKTSLAVACLRKRGRDGLYVSAFKLGVARIQNAAGDGEAKLVERAMTIPWLLIDEVGAEPNTVNNAVAAVVFERYDQNLPTWFTTGLKSDDLSARYGAGFVRRLLEQNGYHVALGDKP